MMYLNKILNIINIYYIIYNIYRDIHNNKLSSISEKTGNLYHFENM